VIEVSKSLMLIKAQIGRVEEITTVWRKWFLNDNDAKIGFNTFWGGIKQAL
jgi:hypothetical protein